MADLLVPVSTRAIQTESDNGNQHRAKAISPEISFANAGDIQSAEQALDVLNSQPKPELLLKVLQWISRNILDKPGLDTSIHTAQASRFCHVLVNVILPNHWSQICNNKSKINRSMRELMILTLSSVTGISAIALRMRLLIKSDAVPEGQIQIRNNGKARLLEDLLSVLEAILERDNFLSSVWSRLSASLPSSPRRYLLWKELVILLGNGRVLSISAEAEDIVVKGSFDIRERSWLSDGSRYCSWLGRNLCDFLTKHNTNSNDVREPWTQMLERAATLGHIDHVVEGTYNIFICEAGSLVETYQAFTSGLRGSTKTLVVKSLLRCLAKMHLSPLDVGSSDEETTKRIGCVAALLHRLVHGQKDLTDTLVEWLTGEGVVEDLRTRRVVIGTLADDIDVLKTALSESLSNFGDKIHIRHTPILHQEGTTENVLLLAGYTHRTEPEYVAQLARSSLYLNAISNRLAAPSPRASVLGMYVGTAVSELVDAPDKRINFSSEEISSAQGRHYVNLSRFQDPFRPIEDLKRGKVHDQQLVTRGGRVPAVQHIKPPSSKSHPPKGSRVISIEEVESEHSLEEEEEDDDEDLPAHAKPDSDASDSDEDPTVINRDKPIAPVYIDDLISGLRDTENYDRHNLALTHASPLIRRKASFGTEVTDNAQDLASIFTGLQNKWNISNFEELRLQAMIAVLVAQPLEMGQWFSAAYFNGDYSVSQRAAVLTTLGLGARELAGYGKEDAALTKSTQATSSFPSKQLPPKLHALYAGSSPDLAAPITTASKQVEQSILRPMALSAADALSGPNALKIRTFSSRMEVEKKRTKPIPNALAKVVADG
ncbi:MAG: hypothetical protein Q9177_005348, partial [Variospora cf. flavescens]